MSGSHVLLTAFHTFLPPVAGVTAVMVTPGLLSRGAESWWVSRDSHGGTARATGGRPGPRGDGPGHGGTARATGGRPGPRGDRRATGGPEGHGGTGGPRGDRRATGAKKKEAKIKEGVS